MKKKRNMSNLDRVLRSIMCTGFILSGPVLELDALSVGLLLFVGVLGLWSSVTAFCMFYDIVGLGTYKSGSKDTAW